VITTTGKRLVFGLEMCALVFPLLYLAVHTLPRAWGKLNTDFPNYYMSARLAREGYDTSRMYEWRWLQREKDHRAVDISVIGLLPITPISTLPMWPLTRLVPLTAKHVWLVLNLALLVPLCWLLRLMTGLPYRRIALAFALSFPLHRNLLYGQYYVLLLLLMVAACWAYLREQHGRLQDFPHSFFCVVPATESVASARRRRAHRGRSNRRIDLRLWLCGTSHVCRGNPSLDNARGGPPALCDRQRFHFEHSALFVPE
jgi:hypothetical protein